MTSSEGKIYSQNSNLSNKNYHRPTTAVIKKNPKFVKPNGCLDVSLTVSDVESMKQSKVSNKTKGSHRNKYASALANKELDRKGRYMKDILKTSECFEHFFSQTD